VILIALAGCDQKANTEKNTVRKVDCNKAIRFATHDEASELAAAGALLDQKCYKIAPFKFPDGTSMDVIYVSNNLVSNNLKQSLLECADAMRFSTYIELCVE
jgi:hypothetical protein